MKIYLLILSWAVVSSVPPLQDYVVSSVPPPDYVVPIVPYYSDRLRIYCINDDAHDVSFQSDSKECLSDCAHFSQRNTCCRFFKITEDAVIRCYQYKDGIPTGRSLGFTAALIHPKEEVEVIADRNQSVLSCLDESLEVEQMIHPLDSTFKLLFLYLYDWDAKEYGQFQTMKTVPLPANGDTAECNKTKYKFENVEVDLLSKFNRLMEKLNDENELLKHNQSKTDEKVKALFWVTGLFWVISVGLGLGMIYTIYNHREQQSVAACFNILRTMFGRPPKPPTDPQGTVPEAAETLLNSESETTPGEPAGPSGEDVPIPMSPTAEVVTILNDKLDHLIKLLDESNKTKPDQACVTGSEAARGAPSDTGTRTLLEEFKKHSIAWPEGLMKRPAKTTKAVTAVTATKERPQCNVSVFEPIRGYVPDKIGMFEGALKWKKEKEKGKENSAAWEEKGLNFSIQRDKLVSSPHFYYPGFKAEVVVEESLRGCRVDATQDFFHIEHRDTSKEFVFRFQTQDNSSFVFQVNSEKELYKWIYHISMARDKIEED